MDIGGVAGNAAMLTNILSVCGKFQLRESEARAMIEQLIALVDDNWRSPFAMKPVSQPSNVSGAGAGPC